MSLTPEQIDVIADKYLVGLFQEMEQDVLADIARRVRKTGRLTETAELMAQAMSRQGFSPAEIRAEVMKIIKADAGLQAQIAAETLEYKKFVAQRVKDIVEEAKEAGNELVANAGAMCFNDDLALWEEAGKELKNTTLPQIVEATKKQTWGAMRNLTQTTALGLRDASGTPIKLMNAYTRLLDKATLEVATGVFTGEEAVNRVIREMANSGVRLVEYHSASGRTTMTELDVAVRRNVRTGVSQMAGRIMEENLRNSDTDLVITSQHMGSRPEHAEWQNKIFSFSGKSKRYPSLEEGTGYGTVTGLKGANCSHNFYPYWPGISVREPDLKEPPPVKINGKEYTYYQATQKQRAYERKLRSLKRETLIQENSGGDPKVISELRSKTRATSREYNSFSAAAGLKTKPYRARLTTGERSSYGAGGRPAPAAKSWSPSFDSYSVDRLRNSLLSTGKYSFTDVLGMDEAGLKSALGSYFTESTRKADELRSKHPVPSNVDAKELTRWLLNIPDGDIPDTVAKNLAFQRYTLLKLHDDLPEMVSDLSSRDGVVIYRGVRDSQTLLGKTIVDMTKYDPNGFVGSGIYGDGTYFTTVSAGTEKYGSDGRIVAKLKPGAKVIDYDEIEKTMQAEGMYGADISVWATEKGYDAIRTKVDRQEAGEYYYTILKRGSLWIQE